MLNPIIQKVANLINDDIDPALRRVYEDIVLDLEKARDFLFQPIEQGDGQEDIDEDDAQTELFTGHEDAPAGASAPIIGPAPSDVMLNNKPAQPAPLPGTVTVAPIPPVGEPVQEFQPQLGAGEVETLQDAPSEPVTAADLAAGTGASTGSVSELVGSLQASHDAAKADGEPVGGADPAAAPAPETPVPEPVADPIV